MKRHAAVVGITLFLLVASGGVPALAQTYDLADYMLPPGGWKIEHGRDFGDADWEWEEGYLASQYGAYQVEVSYERGDPGTWERLDANVFSIAADQVQLVAWVDFEEGGIGLFSPPISIPRSLTVGEPVVCSGVVQKGGEEFPYVFVFMIRQAGLTVQTAAGDFNDCVELMMMSLVGDEVLCSIEYWAPGLGSVKGWETEVSAENEACAEEWEVTSYHTP